MYIRRLNIQNFLRLEAFNVDAEGKHVIIRGENGIGKTSVVEAIWEALQGSSAKDRPEPVHRGAAKALISIDLGDYLVEKHISAEGKSRLVVKAADGSRISSPQKLLDGLLSQYSLDPVAFLHRRPQDQLDDVLKVCGIEPPVTAVEKITGENCPARPGESADSYMERLSADEVGEWYRRRRDQHRVVETNRGAVEKQQALVQAMMAQTPEDLRSAEAIMADMDNAQRLQEAYTTASHKAIECDNEVQSISDKLKGLLTQRTRLKESIASLEEKLAQERNQLAGVHGRITKGESVLSEAIADYEAAKAAMAGKADQRSTIAALRKELADSQLHQKTVIQMETAQNRLQELTAEHKTSQTLHARLDAQLEELRKLRKELLEGVDLGVDGLTVGAGELRLHGVSFKQASQAQKLRVACAVAMQGGGELKLLRIDNAELLDSESRAFLLDLANKQGFQVIMTCVADQAELAVEIIDQEAEPEPAKPTRKPRNGQLFETQRSAAAL